MSQVISQPQVASLDDYDSDVSEVRPGTKVEARSAASMQLRREPRQAEYQAKAGRGRERSNTAMPPPPVRQSSALGRRSSTPAGAQDTDRARAGMYRTESQSRRVQVHPPQVLSRSNSINRQSLDICRNPNCGNPECVSAQMSRPRSTVPQQVPSYPQPPPITRPTVQAMPNYPNAQASIGYGPQPRLRTNSYSQPRPTSWAAPTPLPYQAYPPQHGPPPSPSAYHNPTTNVYRQPAYHTTSVASTYLQPGYTQPRPPTNAMAGMSISRPTSAVLYSTRQLASQTMVPDPVPPMSTQPPVLARTSSLSTRRPSISRQIMPGSFPGQSVIDDLYYSDEYDSDEYQDRHQSKRDSKIISVPARPTIRATQTTPNFSTRTVGEASQRAPFPDSGIDFLRYESADPDRTPRALDSRRYSSTNSSSRSRRPSVSTASSSGRTKATTISSGSGSARQLIEDRDGRRREYQARDRRSESYAEQQIADAMAYQRKMQGPQHAELTAENVQHINERKLPSTRSRASGHSRRSGQSGSRSEGVHFTIGANTFHVDNGTHIEIRPADEERPQQFVFTPGGKENALSRTESKSSGSRVGRSRGGSDRGSVSRGTPIAEVREI